MSDTQQARDLRNALSQFATGVTVVTSKDQQGLPVGMTANSFSSVSLEPPLVSWCIGRESARFDIFNQAPFYTINILSESQQSLSNIFAKRSWDSTVFDEVVWSKGLNDIPKIQGASTYFECEVEHRYDGGDHVILIARVIDFSYTQEAPLVFFNGGYRQLK